MRRTLTPTYFAPGDWNINCSMCGRVIKASQAEKNWQGQWRCRRCNEPRHPQDFVRGVPDQPAAPFVQIMASDFQFDFLIMEGTGTMFLAEVPLVTEGDFQPILMEG